jgi:hypothetical protein
MGEFDGDLSADKCISAGMYWFSRSDLEAAEAWWTRAVQLEPDNPRARHCLDLLRRSSPTGYRGASWAGPGFESDDPFVNPAITPAGPAQTAPVTGTSFGEVAGKPGNDEPLAGPASWPLSNPNGTLTTDPLEFASESGSLPFVSPSGVVPDPWDDSSAATSVLQVSDDEPFDAVAEATPLPQVAREEFFRRYPETQDEIEAYLEEAVRSGDLPVPEPAVEFDEPVELTDPPVVAPPADPLQEARDKLALHDFQGVLDALDALPDGHGELEEAKSLAATARSHLLKMYESKLGDLSRIPQVNVSSEELIWLNLNHRAGFILSQIDGMVSFEDLVALSGMPRTDTLRILTELLQQNVIR